MFALILSWLVLLGSTLCPIWTPQRSATCAGVFPSFSAADTITGCSSTAPAFTFTIVVPGEPNGE